MTTVLPNYAVTHATTQHQHAEHVTMSVAHVVQAAACVAVMIVANVVQFHNGESGSKVDFLLIKSFS